MTKREFIAQRTAKFFEDGDVVNLGIGMNKLAYALSLNAGVIGNYIEILVASLHNGGNEGLRYAAVYKAGDHDGLTVVDHFHGLIDGNDFILGHLKTLPFCFV